MFGNVVPYQRGAVQAGLSVAGYIALGAILFILIKKFKEWLHGRPKSLIRGIILSLFPIVIWAIVTVGLDAFVKVIDSFMQYWYYLIMFIVIGRTFYVLDEAMAERERL
jgi:hypothetical protein